MLSICLLIKLSIFTTYVRGNRGHWRKIGKEFKTFREKDHSFKLKVIGFYCVPNHAMFSYVIYIFIFFYLTRYHNYYLRES